MAGTNCMGNDMGNDAPRTNDDQKDISIHVPNVLRQLRDELRQLLEERRELIRRIGTIKRTVTGLAVIFGDSTLNEESPHLVVQRGRASREFGFTKACRSVLMKAGKSMDAREILNQLNEQAPSLLAHHKDPKNSVITVLNRLVNYGEAESKMDNGRRTWHWIATSTNT